MVHTCFGGRGALSCHVYLRPAQNVPSLREGQTVAPCACHPLGSSTMGSRAFALTHGVLATLPPHRRVLCQVLACWWHDGLKCALQTNCWWRAFMSCCVAQESLQLEFDQHPRRRLPGPRNGLMGHRSWSPTNNHHKCYPQGPKAVALFLCDRPTFALLTPP